MTDEEFADYYPRYKGVIAAIARKMARTDDELFQDLEQTGLITLWHLKPEKATDNPDAYIRKAIRNKMADYMRKHKPGQFDSLDVLLARGDQIVRGEDGEASLLAFDDSRFSSVQRDDYEDGDLRRGPGHSSED